MNAIYTTPATARIAAFLGRRSASIVIETKRRSNIRLKAYGIYASLWAWLHPETMRQGMRGVDDEPCRTDQSA